jgi:hypothetical protein
MPGRPQNASKSKPFKVAVSEQSRKLLERLAQQGIYGKSGPEVAGRFIDQALSEFIVAPKFRVSRKGDVQEAE